ncbi:hypothetical protein M5K25_023239 [Dendrobium thyrsiflorum]|uniref:Uncharacterized protein n=1 Tax=Dendrobium thyrsiflorum TaxID=117978 RepID=A0ABD0U7K2_DENTH
MALKISKHIPVDLSSLAILESDDLDTLHTPPGFPLPNKGSKPSPEIHHTTPHRDALSNYDIVQNPTPSTVMSVFCL